MFHTKLKSLSEPLLICRKNTKKNVPSFRSPCILMNYISAATSNSVCTIRDVSLDRYIERNGKKAMHIRTTTVDAAALPTCYLLLFSKITKIFVPYFSDVQCAFKLCCSSQSTDLLSAE